MNEELRQLRIENVRMVTELKEANAWIKNLEKLMVDQHAMLTHQTARIVDLQTHIENLEGEE